MDILLSEVNSSGLYKYPEYMVEYRLDESTRSEGIKPVTSPLSRDLKILSNVTFQIIIIIY